ncbi:MAG TPA: hypothetical protein VGH28_15250 [Polyangiaceae bacterium]|jgi:hypothetical protein
MEPMRKEMATLPEDLSEYARIHTGPGSWSADSFEESPQAPEFRTPRAPFVSLNDELA